ncbi:probable RNA-binding protein EIF1AD isoform X1 [Hydra vulgaris]|uniref:probable RNA-binding protein EIF1AD isoform X1 n=1 Tax=Hydra vulgaris TaxID=6087 RepID=UPI001F5F5469|nr:probable RNA-binding protein EIF1AD [Hydra vulgaris]
MSKSTKRKHVTKEILDDYYEPNEDEQIVQIVAAKGNNLHEVKTINDESFLVSMPNKYRKSVWVKRGDYVVIQSIKEGHKVQGEIVSILYPKQIKYLKQKNMWPEEFNKSNMLDDISQTDNTTSKAENSEEESCSSKEDDDSSDDTLFKNPNHRINHTYEDDEITSESESSASEEENFDEGKNNNKHCYQVDKT